MSRRLVPRWTVVVPWLALVALALVFRLSLVAEFRASAGDGIHYHQLAQQLRHAHRFAYGPPPQPLTWPNLPLLATVGVLLGLLPAVVAPPPADAAKPPSDASDVLDATPPAPTRPAGAPDGAPAPDAYAGVPS